MVYRDLWVFHVFVAPLSATGFYGLLPKDNAVAKNKKQESSRIKVFVYDMIHRIIISTIIQVYLIINAYA